MKAALFLAFILSNSFLSAHTADTTQIIDKHDTIHLNKTCYLALEWKEIKGSDTAVNRKINDEISGTVFEFSRWENDDSANICDNGITTVAGFSNYRTLFGKHNFVSCTISASPPLPRDEDGNVSGQPYTEFTTLNFNLKTGQPVKFNELFDAQKLVVVDTLVMKGLMDRLKDFNPDPEEWEAQLDDLDFTMNENGVDVYFRGSTYILSIIDFVIFYDKLKPFMGKKGLLNLYYLDIK